MNFKNSSSYVQRQIDNMLRFHKNYARAYVDDIIIFNKILKKHKKHLHAIFDLLNAKNVTLSFKKFFIEYSIVTFLNQKVDVFDLIIAVDKIDVIKCFDFSYTLIDLKLYLRLIGYFRNYVPFYVQKAKALQKRKIVFLCVSSFNKNRLKKIYNQRMMINNFTDEKFNSYCLLQKAFDKTFFLIHFDRSRVFYIDVDASKKHEFEIMMYYLKPDADSKKSRITNIEFIMFLNRLFNIAEFKY